MPGRLAERQYVAQELVPAIDLIFKQQKWLKSELDLLVVGVGPGSFTGVRTAVVTARTLAQALRLPLCGVSLFECYFTLAKHEVGVVLDAGGQACYVAISAQSSDNLTHDRESVGKFMDLAVLSSVIRERQPELKRWLVAPRLLPLIGAATGDLEPLPALNNIAILQAKIAFRRVSLSGLDSVQPINREELSKTFAYEHVRPLYLREASITLKSTVT